MQFATLDPTVRRLVDANGEVLVADTVGFVSELPPELIAAFRATLLEACEADLLLHVVDASDPFHDEREVEVDQVIESIGAGHIPVIRVYNKIDRTGQPVSVATDAAGRPSRVAISALEDRGLEELKDAIRQRLSGGRIQRWIHLEGKDARLRAQLFELGAVSEEVVTDDGRWNLRVDLSQKAAERLARQGGPGARAVREQLLASDTPA